VQNEDFLTAKTETSCKKLYYTVISTIQNIVLGVYFEKFDDNTVAVYMVSCCMLCHKCCRVT